MEIPSFYPYLTARQNLEYYRIQRGIPGKECVDEALEQVRLTDTGKKKFKTFSLGMKQRLGLAPGPDEPTRSFSSWTSPSTAWTRRASWSSGSCSFS